MAKKKVAPNFSEPALSQTYASKTEAVFIPTVSKSLLESIRTDLPEEDGPPELVTIAAKLPGLYATFLGKIVAGSSFRASSLSVGLPPEKVRLWLSQGAADLADDYDTYPARLLLDCQRAASIAVSDAEERVHSFDPSKWLSRSPTGKEFNKGKYWTEQVKSLTVEEQEAEETFDPPPLRPAIAHVSDQEASDKELAEALKVLQDFSIVTDPEFIKQAKQQYKITEGPNAN